jgi:hypothetical protein
LHKQNTQTRTYKVFQNGLTLPGSRIIDTTNEAQSSSLDEFELQAAHYNMACAAAQLGQTNTAMNALAMALAEGFDNLDTVQNDPDLQRLHDLPEWETMVVRPYQEEKNNSNNAAGFNPFGFFQKKK